MRFAAFPPPGASRAEIDEWIREQGPAPEPPHEVPPMRNGPSPMCNACGVVRINILAGPFCKECTEQMQAAGVEV